MLVLIDINHPAQLNFFKNLIKKIHSSHKDKVIVTYLARGKLPEIVNKELPGIEKYKTGRHRGTVASIIFEANLLKLFDAIKLFFFRRPDICLTGSFITGFASKFYFIPNIQLDDDPERKHYIKAQLLSANEIYFPPIVTTHNKIKTYNALKEWAYLSPKYFTPNENALEQYNLKKKEYIFIREVSTGSINYLNQEKNLIASFSYQLPKKYKVILSLEDKRDIGQYPNNWILLKEPIEDIHSLIYYSKLMISSGDSMAREGGNLGVPSIYCGFREMKANQLLIDKGILFKIEPSKVVAFINDIESEKVKVPDQLAFREKLDAEWVDVPDFFMERINQYRKN